MIALFVGNSPLWASKDDDRIKSVFENSYVFQMYLKDDAIRTEVKDGIVTLTGTVAEESHKVLAQETVASLHGVIRVDNRLEAIVDVAAANADTGIGKKVKLTLLFHRNVYPSNTNIEVKDGMVTLTGEALNPTYKDLAGEYARDIEGVKEVKVFMTVAASPQPPELSSSQKIDDASVTAQVRMALATHRSTSSINANVETRDGEVTLSGFARNESEKSRVTRLVSDIHGVYSVKNQMTIDEDQPQ